MASTTPIQFDSAVRTAVLRDDRSTVCARSWGPSDQKTAVLVLDGIGCTGWAFRRIIPRLAGEHRVVLMHYRGHGDSPDPAQPWRLGIHELADDAVAVLNALGIERATAIGFSMGFQVAVEVYKRHRTRLRGLVSLAGPSGRALHNFQGTDVFDHLLPVLTTATKHAQALTGRVWRTLLPSKILQVIGLHTQLHPLRIDLEDFDIYLKQMSKMSPELFSEMLAEASRHCTDDVLSRIRIPALVVAGAQDQFVPLQTMRRVAFAIPTAQWVVIPDASHALPAEFADEVCEHIERFLAELPDPGTA